MSLNLDPLKQIHELWGYLSGDRKRDFRYFVTIVFVSAFLEVASIGALIPFLAVISGGGDQFLRALPYINWGDNGRNQSLFYIATFTFILLSTLSYGMRFLILKLQISFSQSVGHDISVDIFSKTLYQPYLKHKINPTSKTLTVLITKVNSVVYNTVLPSANICSSFLILAIVFLAGVILSPAITIQIVLIFIIFYLTVIRIFKKEVKAGSENIALLQNNLIENIQKSLGGIRDIILDNTQNSHINHFSSIDKNLRNSISKIQLNSSMPRFLLELLAIFSVIAIAIFLNIDDSSNSGVVLPLLGVIAYLGQRLLPLFQQLYSSYTIILGDQKTMGDVLELMRVHHTSNKQIPDDDISFNQKLEIKNLCFSYSPDSVILKDCNLTIKRGDRVGVFGESGSGKSTFLDILMGLLTPTNGAVYIDNEVLSIRNMKKWQSLIGHVPQDIYLSHGTIAENIAFGIEKNQINREKIVKCLQTAGLANFVANLACGIDTQVGERGGLLSGGQVQRIGIARALYKDPKILILDEISSALDKEVETGIMTSLFAFPEDITIVMVAHKESALSYCDYLIRFENKKLLIKTV